MKTAPCLFLLVLLAQGSTCQPNQAPKIPFDFIQQIENAKAANRNSHWPDAEKLWTEIVKTNPLVGEFWFYDGQAHYGNGHYDMAVQSFKKAYEQGGWSPAGCLLQLAKCYAKKKDYTQTLNYLKQSKDAGLRSLNSIVNDDAFNEYKNEPAFRIIAGLPIDESPDRINGWRFDLNYMVGEIKRKAVKPYRFSMEKIDSMQKAIDKHIPTMTDFKVIVAFMKLMVMVNDGHTILYPFSEKHTEFFQNLPLDFYYFEDGFYITSAEKNFEHLIGSKILGFDDKPIDEVLQLLSPVILRDQLWAVPRVGGPLFIRMVPLLHELGISKKTDEILISLILPNGKNEKISVPANSPVPSRKLWDGLPSNWVDYHKKFNIPKPLYLKDSSNPYWFEFLKEKKTVYFQFNRVMSKDNEPLGVFTEKLFSFINTNDVEKLVVDIRLNNGGSTELLIPLMNQLQGCKKIFERGKLFLITGRRTYSAGQNFTSFMEKWTPAILVGEPTGSSPNFVGEEFPFELPYSKLQANVSDWYHQSSWPNDYRKWTAPLIYCPVLFSEYKVGYDPAIASILTL